MTPREFKAAQHALGLSDVALAFILNTRPDTIRKWKREDAVSSRPPNPVAVEALRWMTEDNYEPPRMRWILDGKRSDEWEGE